jgi:uncharacterized protein
MSTFTDRRSDNKYKSTVNRQRFIKRFKEQIKKAVSDAVNKRSIIDMERGEKINISGKDTYEPRFKHGIGGVWEVVHTGNKEFTTGDHIKRQESGQGQGGQASNSGEGWDEFTFQLSRKEFLDLFFEDLALPNLVKTRIAHLPKYKSSRAGYSRQGVPTNLSIIRSLRMAHARKIALGGSYQQRLQKLESALAEIQNTKNENDPDILKLRNEIESLKTSHQKIPFIDTFDLRYHMRVKHLQPSTQAVMFCIMDVSGSMDEAKKDIAKRFFILLYLFLTRNYEKIEVVFIRHHTIAKEVDEQEFFYSRETGGTVVSSALELMRDVVAARYPSSDWNIFAAQASDGDNWSADSPHCQELLSQNIMPTVQYYAYVEIMPRYHQSLWECYLQIKNRHENFAMQTINDLTDIYPVLRELFQRRIE